MRNLSLEAISYIALSAAQISCVAFDFDNGDVYVVSDKVNADGVVDVEIYKVGAVSWSISGFYWLLIVALGRRCRTVQYMDYSVPSDVFSSLWSNHISQGIRRDAGVSPHHARRGDCDATFGRRGCKGAFRMSTLSRMRP